MIGESKRFLEDGMNNTSIQTIEFCIFDDETLDYFRSEFDRELQSVDLNYYVVCRKIFRLATNINICIQQISQRLLK
jgi:hypothetical protein